MAPRHAAYSSTIEASARIAAAQVSLLQLDQKRQAESGLREEEYWWLDFSLGARLPRTEVSFSERWPSNRYASAGQLFVLPPAHEMRVRSGAGHLNLMVCRLSSSFMQGLLQQELEWTDRRLETSCDVVNGALSRLILNMADELRHPGFAHNAMVEGIATQIGVALSRHFYSDTQEGGAISTKRLRAIDARIEHWTSPPTLSELAKACEQSVRQISRDFRASRGIALGKYIALRRLDEAKLRLARGESVKSVAYDLGFSSPSAFCSAFRRYAGVSPGEYRRLN